MPGFKHVVILSDGIRGHFHQSLGISDWLARLEEVKQEPVIEVPKLHGLKKLLMMKLFVRKLAERDGKYALDWLAESGHPLESFGEFKPGTLFISAGSSAAPFCLAIAKATGNKAAVIMTPSVLGTGPFDFAIVPEHDTHDPDDKHVIATLGAPNHIYRPDLREEAKTFFADHDFRGKKIIALLVGGSDANYKLDLRWANDVLVPLRYKLDNEINNCEVLITTSRRTGKILDERINEIFTGCTKVGYMLLASREPDVNPVPAMLGAATHVLVTEDSVSMVSEAVTAGFRVGLLRVPRAKNFIKALFGYGATRFDELFTSFKDKDLLMDLGRSPDFVKFINTKQEQKHGMNFNEAKRAAEHILNLP